MANAPRFSKTAHLVFLRKRAEIIRANHHFAHNMGCRQLGKNPSRERIIAYGQFVELNTLIGMIEEGVAAR